MKKPIQTAFLVICVLAAAFLSCPGSAAAVKATTVRDASFLLSPSVVVPKVEGQLPIQVYTIPKGTEVKLLRYDAYNLGELLRVSLPDGSLGFMSVHAFCDAVAIITGGIGAGIPDGKYTVVQDVKWQYEKVEEGKFVGMHAAPARTMLRATNGRLYDFSYPKRIPKQNYMKWRYSVMDNFYQYGYFEETLKQISSEEKEPEVRLRYDPSKRNLSRFAGYRKDWIESVFGKPYSVAGPQLCGKGLTKALYKFVMWKAGKKYMNAGITVYYDSKGVAQDVIQTPFSWTLSEYKADAARLYFPKFGPSSSGKPNILDRVRIGSMYFIENELGVHGVLGIMGILLLVALLAGLLVTVWIRYILNYGSNDWTSSRTILLMIPVFLYCMTYVSRFPFIIMLVFGFVLLAVCWIPYFFLDNAISFRRCPECHKYVSPVVLNSTEGRINGGELQKHGRSERIGHSRSTGPGDSETVTVTTEAFRYETVLPLTQDMEYEVRCPHCSHEWTQKKVENRPSIRGPILVEVVERTLKEWVEVEKKRIEVREEPTGTLIDTKEESTSRHQSSSSTYNRSVDDGPRYLPYFEAYINGDKGAPDRYYHDCWDSATYELLMKMVRKKRS